jgi:phosphoserine phosphatase RsbU/P
MKIVSGGHPLPLVLRADGKVEEVGIPGMLLGVVSDPELQEAEVELNVGDAIMLYTDGVTDGRREGELFGEQRLHAVFGSCIGMNPEEIADLVERSVVDFWSDEPLDDIAILVLKVCPAR